MSTSDWIGLGSATATFLGTVVALVAVWLQLRKMNQQMTIQHFADYTRRYQEVILRFPEDINVATFEVKGHAGYEPLMRNMRAYFDLSFEEWYLHRRDLIDPRIWAVWHSGMRSAMSKPAFQQAWAIIRRDTRFGADFEAFLEALQAGAPDAPAIGRAAMRPTGVAG